MTLMTLITQTLILRDAVTKIKLDLTFDRFAVEFHAKDAQGLLTPLTVVDIDGKNLITALPL
jgi:hypothetical protein